MPRHFKAENVMRIGRRREFGHELRRPKADLLRDGIYELRAMVGNMHYRILYFFHGKGHAVVSHGFRKERKVPAKEIARAITHKENVITNPGQYSVEAYE